MKYDFIILIEHKTRELYNACLLKYELEKRGYTVKLSHNLAWGSIRTFRKDSADILIVPNLYNQKHLSRYSNFAQGAPTYIVDLQQEQVYSKMIRESKNHYPLKSSLKNYHICWSEGIKKLIAENEFPLENLVVTGAISTDFLRNNFREFEPSRKELSANHDLPIEKKWHLFISSFGFTTHTEEHMKELAEFMNIPGLIDFRTMSIASKVLILEWIVTYLQNNLDEIFIYRPHPAEITDDTLLKLQSTHSNFRVIDHHSIRAWIFACDVIHNWFSTSIVDTYFSGKNTSILRPFPVSDEMELEIMQSATFVTNFEDFEHYAKNPNDFSFPVQGEKIDVFYLFDNVPAYIRICDFLQDLHQNLNPDIIKENTISADKYKRDNPIIALLLRFINIVSTVVPITKLVPKKHKAYAQWLEKENLGIYKEIRIVEKKIKNILDL